MSQDIEQISAENYDADGFIMRARLIPEDRIGDFRDKMEEFVRRHGEDPRFGDWCYFKSNIILPWVVDLAIAPGVVGAVKSVLGPDILLWNSFLPIKPPKSEGHFAWHQDATYWHLTPVEEMVTVWLALSDVTPDNGCMRFLPGSHHQGQIAHEMTKGTKSMLRRGQRALARIAHQSLLMGMDSVIYVNESNHLHTQKSPPPWRHTVQHDNWSLKALLDAGLWPNSTAAA